MMADNYINQQMFPDMNIPDDPLCANEAKFWKYHEKNPKIYEVFDRFAREIVRAKRDQFGVSLIVERIRWFTNIETDSADGFKISNNMKPYYARLWMRNNPKHKGLFKTHRLNVPYFRARTNKIGGILMTVKGSF